MASAIYRLIYRSTFIIEGREAARELDAILAASRRRNEAMGLTGALLHSGAQVVQVLEGPLEAVEAVYDRIAIDLRHTAVELVHFSPVQHSSFPGWSMAYVPQDRIDTLLDSAPLYTDRGPEVIEAALAAISSALGREGAGA